MLIYILVWTFILPEFRFHRFVLTKDFQIGNQFGNPLSLSSYNVLN